MPNLQKSLNSLKVKVNQIIPGTLGLSDSLVNVPNRPGFSYVKLLGNTNELIQAYNTVVTPQYGVPVQVQWNGTQYIVIGRDVQRYTQWNYSAYLPLHGDTHQWMGGDTTWILSEQFYPLSVSPSGSSLFIAPYTYNWLGNWRYGGNTGTNAITLPSDPTKQKIMLLYLDGPTGNPTWLPGTEAPLYTNINQLLPYLPSFDMSLGIPLAMVGIPSGTTSWAWSNLYDIRQFFGGSSSGSGSYGIGEAPIDGNLYGRMNAGWSIVSGSFAGALTPSRVVITDPTTGALITDNYLYYNNRLIINGATSIPATNPVAMHLVYDGTGVTYAGWTASASAADAPYFIGYRSRGTMSGPAVLQADDFITYFRGRGWDGAWTGSKVGIAFLADGIWDATHHATRIEFSATGVGSGASMATVMTLYGTGVVNIPTGATYNINGSPHTHAYLTDAPSDGNTYGRNNATWVVVTGGGGDVVGPAGAVADNFASFNATTGKLIKDSGYSASSFLTSVTAHNILSTTHGDTLADSVAEGDILIGNATPKWARLPANSTATKKYLRNYSSGLPSWEQVDWSELNSVPTTFAPVAHNILSTSHGDTLADSVARGDILYGNATPKWARLAFPGTPTGKVLQATATDVAWSTNPITIGVSASISNSNTGDQTITLTSDVTGSGTGSFATTIANSAVTLAKMADMATASLIYRKTAGVGAPEVNTLATLKTDLGLSGSNSGDQIVPNNEAGAAHNFLTAYNSATGAWSKAQPSASDVSGLGTLAVVNDAASDGSTYGRKNGAWSAVSAGGGDISGTGIVGQVAEFVTNTKTLQASNLIAPANLLTLLAAGAYTLTIPATGTMAMLNQANSFTLINPLTTIAESWIGPSSTAGIYFKGGNVGIGTTIPDYQLSVNATDSAGTLGGFAAVNILFFRVAADSGGIKNTYGLHVVSDYNATGTYYAPKAVYAIVQNSASGTITEASALMGLVGNVSSGTITTAKGLYAKIQNPSTGTITNAQVIFVASPTNAGGGTVTNAYGLYIENISVGSTLNYAIYTNAGLVHFGDAVDAASLTLTTPLAVAQGGTGATNATDAKTNLGITSGSSILSDERSWFLV